MFVSLLAYNDVNETSRYLCNHRRAYKFFTDSISPKCNSVAFPCESYEKFETGACFTCDQRQPQPLQLTARSKQVSSHPLPPPPPLVPGLTSGSVGGCGKLGYYSDKAPGRGSLYLLTREEEPFCGKHLLKAVAFII